ncbi:hypothetical protein SEUCBS139899_002295 [Sporothrix eucalyptigena]|uniref:Uncharacterized protein n=1 Tax=Sporothrix eucalyptigena TaxID=1812306 RepID=A0ABP0BU99_9PEZI
MATPADTVQSIQAALEPFVRPREETAHIRRVLRAHLAAGLKSDNDGMMDGSLALVELAGDTAVLPESRGLQRAYLRALQANLEARRTFDQRAAVVAEASTSASAGFEEDQETPANNIGILQDHLATVKLNRKRDRLQVVNRYLDALGERPVAIAAGEDYLHPEFIYGDATLTLPSVPKAVVDGLAEDASKTTANGSAELSAEAKTAAAADLEALVARLEKSVLRAQLVLRQEEKRLAAAKERTTRKKLGPPTEAAKLHALGVARDELIAWMETELSNAGSEERGVDDEEEDEEAAESSRQLRQSLLNGHDVVGSGGLGSRQKTVQLNDKLDNIHDKYTQYVEARRALVATVGTMAVSEQGAGKAAQNPLFANMPQLPPNGIERAPITPTSASTPTPATPQITTNNGVEKAVSRGHLLLAPYLERLLAVARDQKADIAHKAHYNVLLAKRLKDTCQMLDHLADESQLLPRYGSKGAGGGDSGAGGGAALLRKKGILAPAQGTATTEGVSQRVTAWTEAADSAKIATFEAVFEKVEEGQVALEEATQSLEEAEKLLGKTTEGEEDAEGKKENRKPDSKQKKKGDIWSALNGELGLLKAGNGR